MDRLHEIFVRPPAAQGMLPALSSSSRGTENSVGWRAAGGEAAENGVMAPRAVGCGRLRDSAVCGFRQMG